MVTRAEGWGAASVVGYAASHPIMLTFILNFNTHYTLSYISLYLHKSHLGQKKISNKNRFPVNKLLQLKR